jgi:hypothetical protein
MDKFLKLSGNILSILAVLAFMVYAGLNTAYDISSVYQDANAELFKDIRNMLLVPGFVVAGLGLALSGAYVAKNKDELSGLEMAVAVGAPTLAAAGLAVFAFIL